MKVIKIINFRNSVVQYSLMTLMIMMVMIFTIRFFLVKYTTDSIIGEHIELYPMALSLHVKNNPEVMNTFINNIISEDKTTAPEYVKDLMDFGSIYNIKVWSKNGVVLWSEDQDIIGEDFSDDEHFIEAMLGEVIYFIEEEELHQSTDASDFKKMLEIYTPIKIDNEIIGVIEVYELYKTLGKDIKPLTDSITIIMVFGALIFYIGQVSIFYRLYKRFMKSQKQLKTTKKTTLFALATLAETRNKETGEHLKRTAEYVRIIAEEVSLSPQYSHYITKSYIEDLILSSTLHDIGKVGIRDSILLKKGKLTVEEFEEMKSHCVIGAETLNSAEEQLDFKSFLSIAKLITRYHHEKWNGMGYPEGLIGEDIPIAARIMAIADVYDALRSKRTYKDEMCHEEARDYILSQSGEHFDPLLVKIFASNEDLFKIISMSDFSKSSQIHLSEQLEYNS